MWPWEHLAVGYIAVSLYYRGAGGRRPDRTAALLAALGSQLPDLIDKPLSWTVGVLPSGLSLAHSLFFAVPVAVVAIHLARGRGRTAAGIGFALAYGSHLLGDASYPLLTGGSFATGFMFWPLTPTSSEAGVGFLARFGELSTAFLRFLGTPAGRLYVLFELSLLLAAALLWAYDGRPGLSRPPDTAGDTKSK